jgi:hypothetical protein
MSNITLYWANNEKRQKVTFHYDEAGRAEIRVNYITSAIMKVIEENHPQLPELP